MSKILMMMMRSIGLVARVRTCVNVETFSNLQTSPLHVYFVELGAEKIEGSNPSWTFLLLILFCCYPSRGSKDL